MGGLFKGASLKVLELTKRAEPAPQRRTTAPAPTGNKSFEGQRLRPQSSANESRATEDAVPSASKQIPRKKLMLGAGGVVLLASVAALQRTTRRRLARRRVRLPSRAPQSPPWHPPRRRAAVDRAQQLRPGYGRNR